MSPNILLIVAAGLLVGLVVWAKWYARYLTKQMPPAGKLVETSTGPVHVIDRGPTLREPPQPLSPIVVVHGSMTNALDMDIGLAPLLEPYRQVVIPDRPGHGFTPRGEDAWRLDVQAARIKAAVDALGVERPILLGQSYGGAVALRYALDNPDDVAGLVLVAPVSHRWPGGVAWYNRVSVNPSYGWLLRNTFIALYGRYGSPRAVTRALHGSAYQATYHARTRVGLTFRPSSFRSNAEDIVRLYEQLVAMDLRYHEILVPTEIVAGTHDMTVVTSVHARALVKQIPDARLRVIDHGGHALHHSHPHETMAAITRLDERLVIAAPTLLQGAFRRLTQVIPGASAEA